MKYTEEQLKKIVLSALEEAGYYSALWGERGGKDAREDKGYFNGRSDALLMIYGVENFEKSEEARAAYRRGENKYYHENDEEEEYEG